MSEIEVAVPTPLARTFTYKADHPVAAGTRVLVPFGRRRVVGVALGPAAALAEGSGIELKSVESIIDQHPVYSPQVLEIAKWISTYYMHPLGEVLRTMLPAGTTKVVKETYELTPAGQDAILVATTPASHLLAKVFDRKKKQLAAATLTSKLEKLWAADATLPRLPVKDLMKLGLVTLSRGSSMRARASESTHVTDPALATAAPATPPVLTAKQKALVEQVTTTGLTNAKSSVFLLHGVTGSGKTEVYLRLISAAMELEAEAQALVLVPEISLTPQMTRVFERRFPGQVAVVHSAMSDPDRWAELSRVRAGEARILIGPRSAVFGPFQKLKLILVDEEHDGSYKQSTGLTYNGRDVAVLRGKLENATVVLGSATPSMESYNNALQGRYTLLEMPERVTGRPLPEVELITTDDKAKRKGTVVGSPDSEDVPIDPRVIQALEQNRADGRQAIVLVNRRGYAYYLFSLEEKKAVQCPYCSISLTLHARSTVLRCHYCDYSTTVSKIVQEKPDQTLVSVGYGSQKAEDCLQRLLPKARIVRLDSDSVVQRDLLPKTLSDFRDGKIDILVGTQILAKGHDFPNVTLIVILEVDQLLGLPDFRAGERTFQLLVQASGRAGRAELPGRVMIQTMRTSHPVVHSAIKQDYHEFAERELKFRQQHAYPPFSRMIAIEFNSPDKPRLVELCRRIERWVEQMAQLKPDLLAKVRILGPGVPPIETIRSRHRRTVIFSSDHVDAVRQLVAAFQQVFAKPSGDVRLKIDVDPQSLI